MKTLGIDFGLKRVGLAVSDPDGTLAFPLATITRTSRDALFAGLVEIVGHEGAEAVVVGWPAPAQGQDSLTARQAVNFAQSLARRVSVPVWLMDETLSSEEALGDLRTAGVKRVKREAVLDQQAAVRILQSYLAAPESARLVVRKHSAGAEHAADTLEKGC